MNKSGLGRRRRPVGMTLLELIVAITISSMVMIALASLQHITTLQTKNVFGQVWARQTRMMALDQVRYRLMNARVGSVTITDSGHMITFQDLNLSKTLYSWFQFNPANRTLSYNELAGDGIPAKAIITGPVDITFTKENPALVKIWVKTVANYAYGQVDSQDGVIKVQLRTANSANTAT